jgi:hypothetical protein
VVVQVRVKICASISTLLESPTVVTSKVCTTFMVTFPEEIACGTEGSVKTAVLSVPNAPDSRQLIRLVDGGTLLVDTFIQPGHQF